MRKHLEAKFELRLNDFAEQAILIAVQKENECGDDVDSCLDHLAYHFRNSGLGFWVYRGGNHIALHFKDANGPCEKRAVLIA